jgi:hypothetical protein
MPSKSKAQRNFMAAAAHNPAFAKKVGIPMSVAKDYSDADKGKKFGKGGTTSDKAQINRQKTNHGRTGMPFSSFNKLAGMAKGGDVKKEMKAAGIFAKAGEKKLAKHEYREAAGKEKDTPAIAKKEMSVLKRAKAPKDVMDYEKKEHASMGMKKGGGIESKGKTRGSVVRMASGGVVRKFAKGGSTVENLDDMSFKEAFRKKLNELGEGKTFKWKGDSYTTDTSEGNAKRKKAQAETEAAPKGPTTRSRGMPEVTVSAKRNSAKEALGSDELPDSPMMRALRGSDEDRAQYKRNSEVEQANRDKRTAEGLTSAVMGPIAEAGTGVALGGLSGLGRGVRVARSAGMAEDEAANMVARSAQKAAARKAAEQEGRAVREAAGDIASDRRTANFREKLRQEANRKRIAESPGIRDPARPPSDADLSGVIEGYKKGGGVKKFSRGGGIESRGKTRGRFI